MWEKKYKSVLANRSWNIDSAFCRFEINPTDPVFLPEFENWKILSF